MTAPLILAFDTASAHCAVAVVRGDEVLESSEEIMAKGQAERLLTLVEELLSAAHVRINQLDAIGVGTGPGNFTGIRISVAAARGLALALKVPAVGINAFDALRYGSKGPCICTVDARHGMTFAQGFNTHAIPAPALIDHNDLPNDVPVIGAYGRLPSFAVAEAIARLTAVRFSHAPAAPAPLYLRAADAAPSRDTPPLIVP